MEFQLNKSVCLKPATGRQSQLSDGNAAGETESCDSSTQSVRVESPDKQHTCGVGFRAEVEESHPRVAPFELTLTLLPS